MNDTIKVVPVKDLTNTIGGKKHESAKVRRAASAGRSYGSMVRVFVKGVMMGAGWVIA